MTLDLVEGDGEVTGGYVADRFGKQGCQPVLEAVEVLAALIRQARIVSHPNRLPGFVVA